MNRYKLTPLACLCLLNVLMVGQLLAQDRGADDEKEIPPPKPITLTSRDNVEVHATYFPGFKQKEAIPFILIHAWEGQRTDYEGPNGLASELQKQGDAVVTVDLRGHGETRKRVVPGVDPIDISLKNMPIAEVKATVLDIEAVKSFLIEEHNKGKCNIEMLCVVGAKEGGLIATEWAVLDWSWPQLPAFKQGQDVKAVVLLSPERTFKGLSLRNALRHNQVRGGLSLLIVAGEKSRGYAEAKRVYNVFKPFHPDVPDEERAKKQTLFFVTADTSLEGTAMLGEPTLGITRKVLGFVDLRLLANKERYPWAERKRPL